MGFHKETPGEPLQEPIPQGNSGEITALHLFRCVMWTADSLKSQTVVGSNL